MHGLDWKHPQFLRGGANSTVRSGGPEPDFPTWPLPTPRSSALPSTFEKNLQLIAARPWPRSLRSALTSICRFLSRVTVKCRPISSSQPQSFSTFRKRWLPSKRSRKSTAAFLWNPTSENLGPTRVHYNEADGTQQRDGLCPGGEIGRRKGLKILWWATTVWVQFPPRAPTE